MKLTKVIVWSPFTWVWTVPVGLVIARPIFWESHTFSPSIQWWGYTCYKWIIFKNIHECIVCSCWECSWINWVTCCLHMGHAPIDKAWSVPLALQILHTDDNTKIVKQNPHALSWNTLCILYTFITWQCSLAPTLSMEVMTFYVTTNKTTPLSVDEQKLL